jgi:NarL family two-component system sensor histidine kinase LiaS
MEERQRLARELHDSVSQALFALSMMAESALRQADSGCGQLRGTLTTIADMANQAQREMRALLLHLRPVELAGRTFVEAASAFLRAVEERYGLHCTFACDTAEPMPPLIEEHLFRILQESLANVLKHANARHVRVQVLAQASAYELSVTDDGVGLPASEAQLGDTFGIAAMRERAESLGGRFRLLRRDRGTTVSVVIPRTGAGDAND